MPRAPDLAGCVLDGRYELQALIGEGTFGCVYRGRDRRLARTVAVKVIKPWWAEDPEWVRSFEHEAQLLASVNDPGIVQIFDVGHAAQGLYYVAEFIDGESLAGRLRRGALSAGEACEIAAQLCRGLGHAHDQLVVHRDIKPANILVSAAGQVKLSDFGIARLAEGNAEGPVSTIVGTPRYMAPEQARGLPATPAMDIYSVGIVLYEMLAGSPPFTGDSVVELALRHAKDSPPSLSAGTPLSLVSVVERALAKDPAARYQSCGAMADGLEDALAELSVAAVPVESLRGAVGEDVATAILDRAPMVTYAGRGPVRAGTDAAERTRVAPLLTPRRNVNPPARRRSVAALSLAFALLAGMILAAMLLAAPATVRVPQFRGLGKAAITSRTHRLHLHPVFTARYDRVTAGLAIAQSPAPGVRVDRDSTVRIVLSEGPPPVEVPRLIGETAGSARAILRSLGLGVTATAVPAPGVQAGTVTSQAPAAGIYLRPRTNVTLSVAEVPSWRTLTSFSGNGNSRSVPFRIRGPQWRVAYRLSYVGTCTFIIFCSGPSAQVINLNTGSVATQFDLNDGGDQTHVFQLGPGLYQIRVAPGSDTAKWAVDVQDYY